MKNMFINIEVDTSAKGIDLTHILELYNIKEHEQKVQVRNLQN